MKSTGDEAVEVGCFERLMACAVEELGGDGDGGNRVAASAA